MVNSISPLYFQSRRTYTRGEMELTIELWRFVAYVDTFPDKHHNFLEQIDLITFESAGIADQRVRPPLLVIEFV